MTQKFSKRWSKYFQNRSSDLELFVPFPILHLFFIKPLFLLYQLMIFVIVFCTTIFLYFLNFIILALYVTSFAPYTRIDKWVTLTNICLIVTLNSVFYLVKK